MCIRLCGESKISEGYFFNHLVKNKRLLEVNSKKNRHSHLGTFFFGYAILDQYAEALENLRDEFHLYGPKIPDIGKEIGNILTQWLPVYEQFYAHATDLISMNGAGPSIQNTNEKYPHLSEQQKLLLALTIVQEAFEQGFLVETQVLEDLINTAYATNRKKIEMTPGYPV